MQKIKKLILCSVAIICLFFALALLLPEKFEIEKRIFIERPPVFVFMEVRDYQNWMHWSPWAEMEPTATYTYQGSPGEVGFRMGWIGEDIGEGSLTLVSVMEPYRLEGRLEFLSPTLPASKDIWIFDEKDSGTELRWISTGSLSYPFGRYFGVFMETRIGSQMEKGLKNLKSYLESSAPFSAPLEEQ